MTDQPTPSPVSTGDHAAAPVIPGTEASRSPYRGRARRNFWKPAVGTRQPDSMLEVYQRRYEIAPTDRIATAGSCFAQHISRYMRRNGYRVMDLEPAPREVPAQIAHQYGYGVYSARYGNIYYVRQLLQLAREALAGLEPAEPVWARDGRYYDAQRPSVEPDGLESPGLVLEHRRRHLEQVREMLTTADVLVFTMGLTEGWEHVVSGTVYPTAPGTIAGDFDPEVYAFRNFTVAEVHADFAAFRELAHRHNPGLRFLLTVSPVPLAATATDANAMVATTYSKAVLRAAAGQLYAEFEDVDYFPSYEIITAGPGAGRFFAPGLRDVTAEGVDTVMGYFFAEHPPAATSADATIAPATPTTAATGEPADGTAGPVAGAQSASGEELFCEEALLEAFGS
ncbi:MAG: hypothetical protein MOP51_1610 [Citricoccus sp.]|jgi:hypothetical protein|nr:hypothetical protein [Citricoccus sp. WCRC_4]